MISLCRTHLAGITTSESIFQLILRKGTPVTWFSCLSLVVPSQTMPCLAPNSCSKWAHVHCQTCWAYICSGYISEVEVDMIFRELNRSHNLMRCATKMFVCKPVKAQLSVKCVGFTWAFCHVSLSLYLCADLKLGTSWLVHLCTGCLNGISTSPSQMFLTQALLATGLCSRSAEVKVKCFRRNFKWTSSECVGRSTLQNYS